jgi:hypothetical protein
MVEPKLLEAWHRMMAEAMRGAGDAQGVLKAFAEAKNPAEWFARWMQQNDLPGSPKQALGAGGDEASEEWLEQWYRAMGVVPRGRYLELLERYDTLRRELEQARDRIERLEKAQGTTTQERAADDMMEVWKSSLDETLRAQRDWMQSFLKQQQYLDEGDHPRSDHSRSDRSKGDAS